MLTSLSYVNQFLCVMWILMYLSGLLISLEFSQNCAAPSYFSINDSISQNLKEIVRCELKHLQLCCCCCCCCCKPKNISCLCVNLLLPRLTSLLSIFNTASFWDSFRLLIKILSAPSNLFARRIHHPLPSLFISSCTPLY